MPAARENGAVGRSSAGIPRVLDGAAAWSWRVLLVAAAGYLLVLLMGRLMLVVVPTFIALLFTALLYRPARCLWRFRTPRPMAAAAVLMLGLVVVSGTGYLVSAHVAAHTTELTADLTDVMDRLGQLLTRIPGLHGLDLGQVQADALSWLERHRMTVAGSVFTTGQALAKVVTALLIALFLAFFFLVEGERLWAWVVRLMPARVQASVNGAGHRGWQVLSGWLAGTATIAVIHGVVIGVTLWLLGTPLALALALLVFVGSFIPLLGAVVFGGLAVLVTLLSVGVWPAVILLVVLVVENQLESFLLQPLIIGRAVNLHPVAILLLLTSAGAVGGLIGAILVVPLVAAAHAAVKYLTGIEDIHGRPLRGLDRLEPMAPLEVSPREHAVSAPRRHRDRPIGRR